jgi:hypothetical protein
MQPSNSSTPNQLPQRVNPPLPVNPPAVVNNPDYAKLICFDPKIQPTLEKWTCVTSSVKLPDQTDAKVYIIAKTILQGFPLLEIEFKAPDSGKIGSKDLVDHRAILFYNAENQCISGIDGIYGGGPEGVRRYMKAQYKVADYNRIKTLFDENYLFSFLHNVWISSPASLIKQGETPSIYHQFRDAFRRNTFLAQLSKDDRVTLSGLEQQVTILNKISTRNGRSVQLHVRSQIGQIECRALIGYNDKESTVFALKEISQDGVPTRLYPYDLNYNGSFSNMLVARKAGEGLNIYLNRREMSDTTQEEPAAKRQRTEGEDSQASGSGSKN